MLKVGTHLCKDMLKLMYSSIHVHYAASRFANGNGTDQKWIETKNGDMKAQTSLKEITTKFAVSRSEAVLVLVPK